MTIEKEKPSGLEALALLALAPFLVLISAPIHGFVLMKLWGWFIVPTFGLKALTILQCIGLSAVVRFMGPHCNSGKFEGFVEELSNWFGRLVAINGLSLLFGYIIHRLML